MINSPFIYTVIFLILGEGFVKTSEANVDKDSTSDVAILNGPQTNQRIADISIGSRKKRESSQSNAYVHPVRVLENAMDTEFPMSLEVEHAKENKMKEFFMVRGIWNKNMTIDSIESNGRLKTELKNNITKMCVKPAYPKLKFTPLDLIFSLKGSEIMFHYFASLEEGSSDYDKKAISETFVSLGKEFVYVYSEFLIEIDKTTVYQAIFRLKDEPWEVYYKDLTHIGSRKIIDILLQYTRQMYRNKFGEFFYRSLINGFIQNKDRVIVHSMVLLDPSVYNVVDTEDVWNLEAKKGYLGKFNFDKYDYLVRELRYVPKSIHKYLVATETRDSFVTNSTTYFVDIALPIFGVMFLIIFIIFACAWEGFICKNAIEGKFCCSS